MNNNSQGEDKDDRDDRAARQRFAVRRYFDLEVEAERSSTTSREQQRRRVTDRESRSDDVGHYENTTTSQSQGNDVVGPEIIDGDEPIPAIQMIAALDRDEEPDKKVANKGSTASTTTQIHGGIEYHTSSTPDNNAEPIPMEQLDANFFNEELALKRIEHNENGRVELIDEGEEPRPAGARSPTNQVFEERMRNKAASTTSASPQNNNNGGDEQQRRVPAVPNNRPYSQHILQSLRLPTRPSTSPPGQEVPPSSTDTADIEEGNTNNNSNTPPANEESSLPCESSVPILEATLVEEQPPPESPPLAHAIRLADDSLWKRRRNTIAGVLLIVIAAMAVALGVALPSQSGNNESSGSPIVPPIVMSTISPSQDPSISETAPPSWPPSQAPAITPNPIVNPSFKPTKHISSLVWTQQGEGLGEANEGRFGESVAISGDGRTMAAGADYRGQVKVYHKEDEESDWGQRGWIISGGYVVSLSHDGNVLAVGGPFSDAIGTDASDDSGKVMIYKWDGADSMYKQQGQTLHGEKGNKFGSAVSLSTDAKWLAVGVKGFVKLFRWDNITLHYDEEQLINGESTGDRFGAYVSLAGDGKTLAIGAPSHDDLAGKARVYRWDERTSEFKLVRQTFNGKTGSDPLGNSVSDQYGSSVSLSFDGKIFAVGLGGRSVEGSGQVKIYEWDVQSLTYKQRGQSIFKREPATIEGRDIGRYDVTLSRDGNTLAIGRSGTDENEGNSGQVTVFWWDEEASDYKQVDQTLNGEAEGDQFGESVSMSGDGKTISIGAPFSDANGRWSGKVEVYAAG